MALSVNYLDYFLVFDSSLMILLILAFRKHVKLSWRIMSPKMRKKTWTWTKTCKILVSFLETNFLLHILDF